MIDHLIPKQGFEIIGERIVSILCAEFSRQSNKYKNLAARDVKFFKDRVIAVGEQEGEVINVAIWKGDYNNKGRDYVDGHYQYVIDLVASSGSRGEESADKLANAKLQKLMGMVRYILEHPTYTTLDFDLGFIRHTEVMKFQILRPDDMKIADSTIMAQGQIIFLASCGEVTTPGNGIPATGVVTDVKVDETDIGFQFEYVVE